MDIEIPKQKLRQRRRRQILIAGGAVALIAGGVMLFGAISQESVSLADIKLETADRGDIAAAVNGNGTIAAAFEEVIVSPVNSRIMEVYHHSGDVVEAGTPLLKLDLAEVSAKKDTERDELSKMRLEMQRLQASQQTRISDLHMQIKVAEMKLQRQQAELVNERYLDSIGSGTSDRVREVELALRTQRLELEQLRGQLVNEQRMNAADLQAKQLEISMKENSLGQTGRILADAEIRSPRRATVISISDRLGAAVNEGQQVAVISDLGHYRIDATISEGSAQEVGAGSRVHVIFGSNHAEGFVSAISPTAANGLVDVKITLDNDSASTLRPGIKADIKISNGICRDVVRIPNLSFYSGPNSYPLYIRPRGADHLELRNVRLGRAGYDYVEVLSGIQPGDEVVSSSTSRFGDARRIKLKK